jgi:hypothetical protein
MSLFLFICLHLLCTIQKLNKQVIFMNKTSGFHDYKL